MKAISQQILSVLMAMFVLASTISWTVEKHYCMGHMVDLSVFGSASSCGMPMPSDSAENEEKSNSCCDDEVFVVHGQDDLKASYFSFNLEEVTYLLAYTYTYFLPSTPDGEKIASLYHQPPPILVRDIHLLDQVFLI